MIVKEGGFEFHQTPTGAKVYFRRKEIGDIVRTHETSGRHCFCLGCDNRRSPRTYRGRVTAAQALQTIDALKREAKKKKWKPDEMILKVWDARPY